MAVRICDVSTGLSPVYSQDSSFLFDEKEHRQEYLYWVGASGRPYLHKVYPLLECPVLPCVNFVLVGHDETGQRHAIRAGRTVEEAQSLNLAFVRQSAALLGANEVHVYALAQSDGERRLVEQDIQSGMAAGPN